MRQVCDGLPARRHSGQAVRRGTIRRRTSEFQIDRSSWKDREQLRYLLQVAPEDCNGCGLCIQVCPAKSKSETKKRALNLAPQPPLREQERKNWDFFLSVPEFDRKALAHHNVKDLQLLQPLFEFSGACAGCGETPYISCSLSCSAIGPSSPMPQAAPPSTAATCRPPRTPRMPMGAVRLGRIRSSKTMPSLDWACASRFDKQAEYAREWLKNCPTSWVANSLAAILTADQSTEAGIQEQRRRVEELTRRLAGSNQPAARDLVAVAGALVRKSVWMVGGDGWAYDIGYGGLDHVFASGRNVNILVLDTEVYSNTGGQMSKSTPRGAVAKFAAGGKRSAKKDLATMAMTYGTVYVARVAMGASDTQTLKAFLEAEAYDGPSLIIAYSACIAHGYDLLYSLEQQKAAVQSAYWPLFRYNPGTGCNRQESVSTGFAPGLDTSEQVHLQRGPLLHAGPKRA